MLLASAVLFGLTALGGLGLLTIRLRGANPPLGLVVAHGTLAATSLVVLTAAVVSGGETGAPLAALVVFLATAAGGFFLFLRYHMKGRLISLAVAFLHMLLAISGYAVLLSAVL